MSGSEIRDVYETYEYKMPDDNHPLIENPGPLDPNEFVGFNYETFRNSGFLDGGIDYDAHFITIGISPYRYRYHKTFVISLPIPFKGNPSQTQFLKSKVAKYINRLKFVLTGASGKDENIKDELTKTLLTNIETAYTKKLNENIKEWTHYLRVKRDIAKKNLRNTATDKLAGSEAYNSIYAGGKNFCPLNSFVPGSEPFGFIYAGDERFHQFILKQGE